ncbi:MAG TPA: ATP-binding protein [Gemmatimonadaceae bacterium]|jgi:signal transduction histidine kinase|nr:ATP-binding protein [Gemmatimonadaceae bacterium]
MTRFLGTEAQLAEAQRIARIGSWEWDRANDRITCSAEMCRLLGVEASQPTIAGDVFWSRVQPGDVDRLRRVVDHAERTHAAEVVNHGIAAAPGVVRFVQTRLQPYGEPMERILVGTMQDLTEQRELEQQLRQAQKMEALGRLAGGVAHDFNNLLAGITCNAELLLDGTAAALGGEQYDEVIEIKRAAERAALLTRQLLAFSRKQGFRPEVLDLNIVVRELERMLRRLLSASVELTCVLDARPCFVEADRGQLEQALVNLVVNARDAMPDGGIVSIETRHANDAELLLVVRDTGLGMDSATRERLFEPFFTTKSAGNGTGLGLATVYGIVRQANGSIQVRSEPGEGAEFRISLPRTMRPATTPRVRERRPTSTIAAAGTILLVEDESVVLESVRRTLERRGHRVIAARTSAEALRAFDLHAAEVTLVLSDAVLPGMSGPELLAHIHVRRPNIPLVLMSGYTKDTMDTDRLREIGCWFVEKPFSHERLLGVLADATAICVPRAG